MPNFDNFRELLILALEGRPDHSWFQFTGLARRDGKCVSLLLNPTLTPALEGIERTPQVALRNATPNDAVKVRLTEHGMNVLELRWRELRGNAPLTRKWTPPARDEEGFVTMPLWSLIETFGPFMNAGVRAPFNEIKIGD